MQESTAIIFRNALEQIKDLVGGALSDSLASTPSRNA
jgi:hypothetical protein